MSVMSRVLLGLAMLAAVQVYCPPTTAAAVSGPVTSVHYVPADAPDFPRVVALGFNMVRIPATNSSIQDAINTLNSLPKGVNGLVRYHGGCPGDTPLFREFALAFQGAPSLYGFYLYDEPQPDTCSAASIKAASDRIHAIMPDAKTFIVLAEQNNPRNYMEYASAVNLVGLSAYPCVPWAKDCQSSTYIVKAVKHALDAGVPAHKIVPIYQAAEWPGLTVLPTVEQALLILATWGSLIPTPAFDYVYTWKRFGETKSLQDSPELQELFRKYFMGIGGGHVGTTTW